MFIANFPHRRRLLDSREHEILLDNRSKTDLLAIADTPPRHVGGREHCELNFTPFLPQTMMVTRCSKFATVIRQQRYRTVANLQRALIGLAALLAARSTLVVTDREHRAVSLQLFCRVFHCAGRGSREKRNTTVGCLYVCMY